jgi:hypothetical protein
MPGTGQIEGHAIMSKNKVNGPIVYQIKMQGKLDESWSGWLSGMTITLDDNMTTLTGAVADQSALRGILTQLWDLNLDLISVNRVEDSTHSGARP